MKTLQRLRHVRRPGLGHVPRQRLEEERAVSRSERRIWFRRIRMLFLPLLLIGLSAALGYRLWTLRTVVDGIVQTNLVVARAPAPVRVAEVFCEPGTRCRLGDPLLRLEALSGQEERRALELLVKKRQLRLALVLAGGKLDTTDLARRGDLVAEADREIRMAEADYNLSVAKFDTLAKEKDLKLIELLKDNRKSAGLITALRERLKEAGALVGKAQAEEQRAEYDAEKSKQLESEGLTPTREVVLTKSAHEASRKSVESIEALVRSLQSELETAEDIDLLEKQQMEAVVQEIGSRIETAYREVEAALTRRDLWQDILKRRNGLFPLDRGGPERLRELELELLRTEVEEAEALMAKLDRELGSVIVHAEFNGVVDQVHVSPGDVAEMEAPLASYFDPSEMWVVAYPTPALAGQAYSGRTCTVVPEGTNNPIECRVSSVGLAWVPCPPLLYLKSVESPDMRLPVRIDCEDRRGKVVFRPNMRVKVVFKP